MSEFRYGIEHEVAFRRADGRFADFTNTDFQEFQQIIDQLPEYNSDSHSLRRGDAGIRRKRWYIEGFERYSEDGKLLTCVPKGIEIRTTIQTSIEDALSELQTSYQLLVDAAQTAGFTPYATSYNPEQLAFVPNPPLNTFEQEQQRQGYPEENETALIPMMTYGPDLNLSLSGMDDATLFDIGKKLTWYSPFMVPFSFGLPTPHRLAWSGISLRTFQRTGPRPAVQVFPATDTYWLDTRPTLTKAPRYAAEIGRIEFKAFDSCADFQLYGALLTILKGLVLDETLPERALIPCTRLHQLAAREGFNNPALYQMGKRLLQAAEHALQTDADRHRLALLTPLLETPLLAA